MLFNSVSFIIFFAVVTPLYFILPHRFRWLLLLLSSCYFYMAFVPVYILILGFTIVIDYFAGLQIEKATGKTRRAYLIISLAANIAILAVFKYYNFINENISWLLNHTGYKNPVPYLRILLPIGLSFHTFQAMSYTIEVYRGKQKAEKHFGIYALYVMFYPQLVAGPIERPQNILHQFYIKQQFNYRRVTSGLRLMLWGFFLKMVIADNLALIVNNVFDNYHHFKGLAIITATLSFSLQIFCDFSGYSSIAIGAARIMGINLMENFKQPYLATSIADFWTRWHISLSTWFRDYLYIPLGGNRVSTARWCFNICVVFIISGLWHGASWTFITWGAIHGVLIILEKMLKITTITAPARMKYLFKVLSIIFTFCIVSMVWIFFRATNFEQAIYLLKNITSGYELNDLRGAVAPLGKDLISKAAIAIFIALLLFVQFYREYAGPVSALILRQHVAVRFGIYLFLFFAIALFGVYDNVSFIYFQF
jgi:alginate O-acetyltransferase complex protein AlgI